MPKLTFNPDLPVSSHSGLVRVLFMRVAEELLEEMNNHRLSVVLVPQKEFTNQGGMVRAVEDKNPAWYSKLSEDISGRYASNQRKRNSRGGTNRCRIVKALERLIAGTDQEQRGQCNINHSRLREICFKRLYYGCEQDGVQMPPSPTITKRYKEIE